MEKFKGTPGKFFAQSEELESGDVAVCVCDQYGNSIAFCDRSLGLAERNAELFAAAPDLLEALQEFVDLFPDVIDGDAVMPALDLAYAAIARALGKNDGVVDD